MSTNVYNIVWADDEIDALLETYIEDFEEQGFQIVGQAHNGEELASCLERIDNVDAVIVDANFNESYNETGSERDTSGLDYARSLYLHKFNKEVPFFLFTGRTDELLKSKYNDNIKKFIEDFPRHKHWFHKSLDELSEMFDAIKSTVDNMRTPQYIVRNRYKKELEAAKKIDDATYDFVFDFLIREYNNDFDGLGNPFNEVRKIIDEIFGRCKKLGLVPPIGAMNGIANYLCYNSFSIKIDKQWILQYQTLGSYSIMPKPLAFALKSVVDIVQDASHRNDELTYKVDEYFNKTKDILFLRFVVYILLDVIKWFVQTAEQHPDEEINKYTLWEKVN